MINRRSLVWVLLVVLCALPFLGGVGPIEVVLWLLLFAGWLWLFLIWSRKPRIE